MTRGSLFSLLLLSALACGGCVTFREDELDTIRACRISPAVYGKMVERRVVTPSEVIHLWQQRVPPPLIEKQFDKVGVDYALRQSEVSLLQAAGVSASVIEAMRAASDRYVSRYAPPEFFESHDLESGDYLVAPPVRTSGSLLYGREILQR
jgi:hypothetical protein